MQIEIDISEDDYEAIKRGGMADIFQNVADGIVLPRNHGDLIERNLVLYYCQRLIDVEYAQGTDKMNYGLERVNQTKAIMFHVESKCLCPSIIPASE